MLQIGNMRAFIDGIPDKCKHEWNGATVHQTASGKVITWSTFRPWASYTSRMRDELIHIHQYNECDPVIMSTSSCSKCGKPFEPDIFAMP